MIDQQQTHEHQTAHEKKQPRNNKPIVRGFLLAGAFILVFSLGIGVGQGRVIFGRDSIFNQNVTKGLPANLNYESIEEVYDTLRGNYDGQLDYQELLNGLKEGLAKASGDAYTEYLDEKAAKEFDEELSGSFTGIGAELGKENDAIIIVAPIAGFPAEKAGLKPRDIIVEIDDQPAYDLTVTEAVKRIRGPKDTKVKLKVVRNNSQELTFEIVRDNITIPSVESRIVEGNIGYLKISRFGTDTSQLAREAANSFKAANVRGVVVDVRNNPGGLLDTSVDVASLWLQNKTVLQEKRGDKVIRSFMSKGQPLLLGVPTVVLINEGSASASEILAGALKDNGAATLYGTKSFGKGSVQQIQELSGGGALKVTIARWFTPGGRNIDKEGIEPDTKVELTEDDTANNRDPQLDAAAAALRR